MSYKRFYNYLIVVFISLLFEPYALLAQNSNVQIPNVIFGQITPGGFTPTSTDTTAEAVALYESGDVAFEVNVDQNWVIFKHHIRLLIRRKSAYKRATVEIIARRGSGLLNQKISELEGYTYNLVNSKVVATKLDVKTAHFVEKATEDYWVEKFTMPDVREGSVIEYKYSLRTPFYIKESPDTWRFQRDIPVDWSQYHIVLPNRFPHKLILGGSLKLSVDDMKPVKISLVPGQGRSDAQEHVYAIKNVPAFRSESYLANEIDYISKIDFEPPNYYDYKDMDFSFSWEAIDKQLQTNPNFGSQLAITNWLKKQANELIGANRDTLSSVKIVYDFIRQTIAWNGQYSIWAGDFKQILANKTGDSGDINLLLIALLRAANIDVYPVILSTRSHGSITEEMALLRKFNYVVAQVKIGGRTLFLDATDPYLKLGMLPIHCLNGIGRLINPPNSRFVSLVTADPLSEVITASLSLDESGELKGTMSNSFGGYAAWINYKLLAGAGKIKYLDAVHQVHNEWKLQEVTFSDTSRSGDTFGVTYQLSIADACMQTTERIYFKPILGNPHSENPFKAPNRQYPIDFITPIDETFTATYSLPLGYQVEEIPKPVSIGLPASGGRFLYKVTVNGRQLRVDSRLTLRKPVYSPNEYPALRELFTQLVAKQAEQVVLKRELEKR